MLTETRGCRQTGDEGLPARGLLENGGRGWRPGSQVLVTGRRVV